jgi:hypothetical protein
MERHNRLDEREARSHIHVAQHGGVRGVVQPVSHYGKWAVQVLGVTELFEK